MNAVMLLPADARQSYRAEILRDVLNSNEQLERLLSEEYFVNLIGLISDGHGRIPVFTEDGMLISQDRVHLTKAGAKYVGKRLFEHPLLVPLK
jgi:lysophospholipase L1-like esterase